MERHFRRVVDNRGAVRRKLDSSVESIFLTVIIFAGEGTYQVQFPDSRRAAIRTPEAASSKDFTAWHIAE